LSVDVESSQFIIGTPLCPTSKRSMYIKDTLDGVVLLNLTHPYTPDSSASVVADLNI
jgi:hypothetical protein